MADRRKFRNVLLRGFGLSMVDNAPKPKEKAMDSERAKAEYLKCPKRV